MPVATTASGDQRERAPPGLGRRAGHARRHAQAPHQPDRRHGDERAPPRGARARFATPHAGRAARIRSTPRNANGTAHASAYGTSRSSPSTRDATSHSTPTLDTLSTFCAVCGRRAGLCGNPSASRLTGQTRA